MAKQASWLNISLRNLAKAIDRASFLSEFLEMARVCHAVVTSCYRAGGGLVLR